MITNAHRVNRGEMPNLRRTGELSDFYFLDAADPDVATNKIVMAVRDRIPQAFGLDPIRDIQVLCPMNRGGLGARSLNIELRRALNPPGEIRVERFGWTFCPGDKVMGRWRITMTATSITATSELSEASTWNKAS